MFCGKCGAANPDDNIYCGGCGVPLARMSDELDRHKTRVDLPPGYLLANRYEIIKTLGLGGMGTVYLAHDRSLEVNVAVKVLNYLLARDQRSVRELKQEAKIAMMLGHPHIVRMYNFEDSAEIKFLTMEYVDGLTLSETLENSESKRLLVEHVVPYVKQICAGLAYAHEQKVVHRDIKPANIMVSRQGVIKISDFGIARVAQDSTSRLSNVETSGTLLYMSPEQMKGKDVDGQSDLYSLGATVYELLSGRPPFSTGDLRYQILNELPDPIAGAPERVNEIILKALAKKKEERWKSALEFSDALQGKIEVEWDRKKRAEDERLRQEELRRRADDERRAQEEKLREQARLSQAQRAEEERQKAARAAEEKRQREQRALEQKKQEEPQKKQTPALKTPSYKPSSSNTNWWPLLWIAFLIWKLAPDTWRQYVHEQVNRFYEVWIKRNGQSNPYPIRRPLSDGYLGRSLQQRLEARYRPDSVRDSGYVKLTKAVLAGNTFAPSRQGTMKDNGLRLQTTAIRYRR